MLLAVGRTGSFGAAARALRVHPSTVGRRLDVLEGSLGVKLVSRAGARATLTQAGSRAAACAATMEVDAARLAQAAVSKMTDVTGVVRLTAPPTFMSHYLAPRLRPLLDRHEGLRLELIATNQELSLGAGEADIALRFNQPSGSGVVVRKLAEIGMGFFGNKATQARKLTATVPIIDFEPQFQPSLETRWLAESFPQSRRRLGSNSMAVHYEAVAAGLAHGLLPAYMAGDGRIRRIRTNRTVPKRTLWLVLVDELKDTARIRCVMRHLVHITRRDAKLLRGAAHPT